MGAIAREGSPESIASPSQLSVISLNKMDNDVKPSFHDESDGSAYGESPSACASLESFSCR